jgi:molecular chaperone GrpE
MIFKKQEEENEPEPQSAEGAVRQGGSEAAGIPEEWKEKAGAYWDQLVRLQAEFINYRKRTEKEKAEAIRFGREAVIERMISFLDIMEQALKHSQSATDMESMKKGFEMVVSEFARFLKAEGAEPLKTVGESFDPHLHEAVEQVQTGNEEENNKILEELQKGYLLNGKLLRPARVKVAKKDL